MELIPQFEIFKIIGDRGLQHQRTIINLVVVFFSKTYSPTVNWFWSLLRTNEHYLP